MAMNNGLRSCASKFLSSTQSFLPKSASRTRMGACVASVSLLKAEDATGKLGIHSTGVKKMGGGHAHDEPFYLHAKHMYNLDRMKHQQLKMTLGVLSAFTIGVAVPVYAVIFQQKKTSSA